MGLQMFTENRHISYEKNMVFPGDLPLKPTTFIVELPHLPGPVCGRPRVWLERRAPGPAEGGRCHK